MKRSDFELLIAVFCQTRPDGAKEPERYQVWLNIATSLCTAIHDLNPRFEVNRFLKDIGA